MLADTIAAITTAAGTGAVGIVRLSGPEAVGMADSLFRGRRKTLRLEQALSHHMHYGVVVDSKDAVIDDCLAVVMRGPNSYTGEDVVEFHCHGNPTILRTVLSALVTQGARMAVAGEFTKRAFINGKLDLVQVEAVGDLILAQSAAGVELAAQQLMGGISDQMQQMRLMLVGFLAHVHASIDYPDEVPDMAPHMWRQQLEGFYASTLELLRDAEGGMRIREGVDAVIVGKPNVGKSSLLNALLRTQRAIVTEIAGTTRDVIEESIEIAGVAFRLSDTAGLRETGDIVEKEGVLRTRERLAEANLLLAVFDSSQPLTDEDRVVLNEARDHESIVVLNKSDRPLQIDKAEFNGLPVVAVSAANKTGLVELEAVMAQVAGVAQAREVQTVGQALLSRPRHVGALQGVANAMQRTLESLACGTTPDCLAGELEDALWHLGELTGETTQEDIVSEIFKRFCVGK